MILFLLGVYLIFKGVSYPDDQMTTIGMVLIGVFIIVIYIAVIKNSISIPRVPTGMAPTSIYGELLIYRPIGWLLLGYLAITSLLGLEYLGLAVLNQHLIYSCSGEPVSISEWWNFFYFSFVTATTLGYGDITPQGGYARFLAVFEVSLGPLFLFSILTQVRRGQ